MHHTHVEQSYLLDNNLAVLADVFLSVESVVGMIVGITLLDVRFGLPHRKRASRPNSTVTVLALPCRIVWRAESPEKGGLTFVAFDHVTHLWSLFWSFWSCGTDSSRKRRWRWCPPLHIIHRLWLSTIMEETKNLQNCLNIHRTWQDS